MLKAQNVLTLALAIVLFSVNFNLQIASDLQYEAYYSPDDETGVGIGFFVPLYGVSAFIGALTVWPISAFTTIGRKYTTFIAIGISVLASIIEISGRSYDQHLAGHIIDGFGQGMIYVVAFLWQVEMAEERHRGKRVVYLIIGALTGSAVGSWVVDGTEAKIADFTSPLLTWQVPIALQFIPLFFAAVATYFATESWRWLLSKHRPDRARQIYTTLNAQSSSSAINTEFDAVQAHVRATQFSSGVAMCTKSRSKSGTPSLQPWHRIFLACLLQIAASLSGLSTIISSVGSLSYDFSGPGPSSFLLHLQTHAKIDQVNTLWQTTSTQPYLRFSLSLPSSPWPSLTQHASASASSLAAATSSSSPSLAWHSASSSLSSFSPPPTYLMGGMHSSTTLPKTARGLIRPHASPS